jgi:hypothetical protein
VQDLPPVDVDHLYASSHLESGHDR